MRKRKWPSVLVVLFALVLGSTAACAAAPKVADVSASPATFTPQIPLGGDNAVYALEKVGTTMYAGGNFATIGGKAHKNLGAFSIANGVVTGFDAHVNGEVWAIKGLPGGLLAIGGKFTSVGGQPRTGLAVVNATTGALNASFNAHLNGVVYSLQLVAGRLIVGGQFTKKLEAVNLSTGTDTNYLNLGINGSYVYRTAVSPDGTHLAAVANINSVSGQARRQAFMVNLGASSGTLSSWYYTPLLKQCIDPDYNFYLRGVAFSPDGSYFVLAGTGYVPASSADLGVTICDAAARFNTNILHPVRPVWINYTGGDTLHSVVISANAVYVGGHNRWLDNPKGKDTPGLGYVDRPGIGAIDPVSGKAETWDPERTRGVGARMLLLTSEGLWVGSDTHDGGKLGCPQPYGPNHDSCHLLKLENHAGIGLLPRR